MADNTLWEHQRARHRRAEAVLTRMFRNKELMDQVYDGIERIKRGERGTPLRDLQQRREER